jgi:hypothetical protein
VKVAVANVDGGLNAVCAATVAESAALTEECNNDGADGATDCTRLGSEDEHDDGYTDDAGAGVAADVALTGAAAEIPVDSGPDLVWPREEAALQ